jgi:putative membrane protein
MMVDHHTKANNGLKMVAEQLNVTLPTTLTQAHQAIVDKIMTATDPSFDETYMDAMETAHKLDIAKFQMKSTNAQNEAVKAFATRTLPVLQSHSEMATRL